MKIIFLAKKEFVLHNIQDFHWFGGFICRKYLWRDWGVNISSVRLFDVLRAMWRSSSEGTLQLIRDVRFWILCSVLPYYLLSVHFFIFWQALLLQVSLYKDNSILILRADQNDRWHYLGGIFNIYHRYVVINNLNIPPPPPPKKRNDKPNLT